MTPSLADLALHPDNVEYARRLLDLYVDTMNAKRHKAA